MKRSFLIAAIVAIVIVACEKNKFETRPQITIKSIDPTVIPLGGSLSIRLEYTDKQGDLGKDTLISIRRRLNRRGLTNAGSSPDTLHNIIPDFPNKGKGEFEIKFDGPRYLRQSDIENDSILFRFVAKDRGGNVSDTITTGTIVVLRQ